MTNVMIDSFRVREKSLEEFDNRIKENIQNILKYAEKVINISYPKYCKKHGCYMATVHVTYVPTIEKREPWIHALHNDSQDEITIALTYDLFYFLGNEVTLYCLNNHICIAGVSNEWLTGGYNFTIVFEKYSSVHAHLSFNNDYDKKKDGVRVINSLKESFELPSAVE